MGRRLRAGQRILVPRMRVRILPAQPKLKRGNKTMRSKRFLKIRGIHKHDLEQAYKICFKEEELLELEILVENFLQNCVEERKSFLEALRKNRSNADHLIERVDNLYKYSVLKNNIKLKMSWSDLENHLQCFDVNEKQKVLTWIEENGGQELFK